MMNKMNIFLLSVTFLLSMHMSIHADQDTLILDEWVTVTGVIGKADVQSPESGKWRPVHVGMRIKMAWDVRTHSESSVELSFESGAEIKLSENSKVKLATLYNESLTDVTEITDKKGKE